MKNRLFLLGALVFIQQADASSLLRSAGLLTSGGAAALAVRSRCAATARIPETKAFYDRLALDLWNDKDFFTTVDFLTKGTPARVAYEKEQREEHFISPMRSFKKAHLPGSEETVIKKEFERHGVSVHLFKGCFSGMQIYRIGDDALLQMSCDIERAFWFKWSPLPVHRVAYNVAHATLHHELVHVSENHFELSRLWQMAVNEEKNLKIPTEDKEHRCLLYTSKELAAAFGRLMERRADEGVFRTGNRKYIEAFKEEFLRHISEKSYAYRTASEMGDLYPYPTFEERIEACDRALANLDA